MPDGEAFSPRQREEILRALRLAEGESHLRFSVHVGALPALSREHARRLHAALPEPAVSVLVALDPGSRRLEVVTGSVARRYLDDRSCALAGLSMTTAFSAGDLVGGIVTGVQMLGEHARHPRTLHVDQPE
ncbi:MAG: DUF5130 family protein [Carbonactinosporaceae bacterium]